MKDERGLLKAVLVRCVVEQNLIFYQIDITFLVTPYQLVSKNAVVKILPKNRKNAIEFWNFNVFLMFFCREAAIVIRSLI